MNDFKDLELDEITEWPLVPQLIMVLVLMVLIQGIGYWFYIDPKEERLRALIQQEESLKSTVSFKTSKVAILPQLQAQLDQLSERYQLLLQQLPVEKELASMLAAVNELGIEHNLTFTRIDWGEKEHQEFLYRLPLNIELSGHYHDIGNFAQAIAALPRVIYLENVEWLRTRQNSQLLSLRVQAFTYQFKPEVSDDE